MPLTYGTLEYFQFLTKVFTNAFSIFVIIATLVYIVEKLLQGERLLKTYNSRFVFVLIVLSLFSSVLNFNVEIMAYECRVIRLQDQDMGRPGLGAQRRDLLRHLFAFGCRDWRKSVPDVFLDQLHRNLHQRNFPAFLVS